MFDLSVIYNDVRKMLEGQEEKKETLKAAMGMLVDSIAEDIAVDRFRTAREAYAKALVKLECVSDVKAAIAKLETFENNLCKEDCIEEDPWGVWLKSLEQRLLLFYFMVRIRITVKIKGKVDLGLGHHLSTVLDSFKQFYTVLHHLRAVCTVFRQF